MIRTLSKLDLPEVLVIENTVHVVPWTEETFRICFQPSYKGWVIEHDQKIVGFIIVSISFDECHVLNIGVHRNYQHQGFGRKLLEHAINNAKENKIGIVYLEVRKSNTKAIALYQKLDFSLIGERKDYYPTHIGKEDALIYVKALRVTPGHP